MATWSDWVSVIDRIRGLGYEPTNDLAWRCGDAVREAWRERTGGELPRKELRRKTAGGGSHCFAVYPPDFRDTIDATIHAIAAELDADAARQESLF